MASGAPALKTVGAAGSPGPAAPDGPVAGKELPAATWVRVPRHGRLHQARRVLQVVTSLVFIAAPFVDLLRFDLRNGALILFGASFGVGELRVAYVLVLLSVVVIFAGAFLYGRVYCGWMCPQTTLSELVATFERWFHKRKLSPGLTRAASIAASVGISAFVGWSLVSYFLDPADRWAPPAVAWISWAITSGVLALDFIWLRHRFCVGVCPYGLLQNIIQDSRTLGVVLDPARRSECTDCLLCVRACFMGIDIRDRAFDPNCLNCGDCIAATRIAKRCPEKPLISFRYGPSGNQTGWPGVMRRFGILDARRAVVMALTVALGGLLVAMLVGRSEYAMEIAALYERTSTSQSGEVRNVYRVSLSNHTHEPVHIRIEAMGLPGLTLESPQTGMTLAAGERGQWDVVLAASAATVGAGAHPITVRGVAEGKRNIAELQTHFFVPSRR
jgi:polyferredoxin